MAGGIEHIFQEFGEFIEALPGDKSAEMVCLDAQDDSVIIACMLFRRTFMENRRGEEITDNILQNFFMGKQVRIEREGLAGDAAVNVVETAYFTENGDQVVLHMENVLPQIARIVEGKIAEWFPPE